MSVDLSEEIPDSYNGKCCKPGKWCSNPEDQENKASAYHRIKEEAHMWIHVKTFTDPSTSDWKDLLKLGETEPIIGIGANGDEDGTRFIFYAYQNYSSADDVSQNSERYSRDTNDSWSFSSKPFGGIGSTFEVRVYRYEPGATTYAFLKGAGKFYLEANMFVPQEEHASVGCVAQATKTADGLIKRGFQVVITKIPEALAYLQKQKTPTDFFSGGSVTLSSASKWEAKNMEPFVELLGIIFEKPDLEVPAEGDSAEKKKAASAAAIAATVLPHTLILPATIPDDAILRLIRQQNRGLKRLVLKNVSNMKKVVSALEESRTLDEVILPETKTTLTRELCEAIIRVSQRLELGDARPAYDGPPAKWQESIRRCLPEIEPLPSSSSNDDTTTKNSASSGGSTTTIVASSGKRWTAPPGVCGPQAKNDLMNPVPSENAVALANHFVTHFVAPTLDGEGEGASTTTAGGGAALSEKESNTKNAVSSKWNTQLEAFFTLYITVGNTSVRDLVQQCWLLGELWGISCHLDIALLRDFCRQAWVRLAGAMK